jgi:hypothetical protein
MSDTRIKIVNQRFLPKVKSVCRYYKRFSAFKTAMQTGGLVGIKTKHCKASATRFKAAIAEETRYSKR